MTTPRMRFLAKYRLKTTREFQHVYAQRRSVADGVMIVYAVRNEFDFSRLGLSVSRKVGGAVERNRWKRLFRETFRLNFAKLPMGYDFVVIPRQGVKPELRLLEASFVRLASGAAAKARRA